MDWMVLLPVIVSGAVILLLYTIPPPWVKRYMTALDDFKGLLSPSALGDAIHHAAMKDDGAMIQEAAEHANGIVAENMPTFTKALASEAVSAVSVMTTPGQARALKDKSGAAQGYLSLGGSVQRQAVKTGVEGMAGGALGEIMDHPIYGPIAQQFMANAIAKYTGGNGPPTQGPAQSNTSLPQWRPPM